MFYVYSWTPFKESQTDSFMEAYDLWVRECADKAHAVIIESDTQGRSQILASFDDFGAPQVDVLP